jgi:hypothetical protein
MICLGESKNKNKEEDVIESFNDVMSSKEIIDYWSEISYYKVVEIREQFINLNTYESFFFSFIETIKIKGIDENLNFFGSLLYYIKYQNKYEIVELDNLKIIEVFIY